VTTTAEVREALAAAASTCGREVKPYAQDTVLAGSGYVGRQAFDPRMVFGQTKAVYPFTVRFYLPRGAEISAQQEIDTLCDIAGDGSFLAAVQNGDNWPASLVDYCQVVNVGEINETTLGGSDYLTVDFDLEVAW